ncbi:dipeptide ABC transporter ATP-binding protein [Actinoplanes friuliensis]|uniref:Glutathione import ATP-binding protein gsiA n=1 Tax=Actinoplanes friuliensis DSM 7358 TaxID=1246995 RepID=U5W151_9ACTN|nr:ABC transporter ATP-binding protein [Actinoplanes friuliensis]AGZ42742.1 Glutathione import ATP-binding protein gsiA [Actinoplanes friuliensis DSM 7358]
MNPLVRVEDLHVTFDTGRRRIEAVRGISFTVERGECLAIVGESGSGKSVTARTLVGLAGPGAEVRAAALELDGHDARGFTERDWRKVRGGFAGLVLQDALVSLDPLRRVGDEIGEVLRVHRGSKKVEQLLTEVHVPEPARRARQYPHQLSGGLRQRALIASAVAGEPPLLIADEPTTALDVTVQAQILALLAERKAAGETLLLISHDLAVVSQVADRVIVLKDGRVRESGTTSLLLSGPRDPYTKKLLAAIPSAASRGRRLAGPGEVPVVRPEGGVVAEATALRKAYGRITVVDDVSLTIGRGEIVGLVGESGSGKTTVAQLLFGLVAPTSGSVTFEGAPWSGVAEGRRRPVRRKLQFISQDPLSSFDPRWTVARIVGEALPRGADVTPLLDRVGLAADVQDRYPRQLSGGQRQRVAIARALAPRPSLIICDEPVSALDVSVQAQVLDLLADIRATDGTALLFISHDLGVVHHLADRVLVMHDGKVVEQGPVESVFARPGHEYTRALLAAVPTLEVSA